MPMATEVHNGDEGKIKKGSSVMSNVLKWI